MEDHKTYFNERQDAVAEQQAIRAKGREVDAQLRKQHDAQRIATVDAILTTLRSAPKAVDVASYTGVVLSRITDKCRRLRQLHTRRAELALELEAIAEAEALLLVILQNEMCS